MKPYGKTWWGKRWLEALQNIDYSNRIPKGRDYENNRSVVRINVNQNNITAFVQG